MAGYLVLKGMDQNTVVLNNQMLRDLHACVMHAKKRGLVSDLSV